MPIQNVDLSPLMNFQNNVIQLRNFAVQLQTGQTSLVINWTPIIAQLDATINLINVFIRTNI